MKSFSYGILRAIYSRDDDGDNDGEDDDGGDDNESDQNDDRNDNDGDCRNDGDGDHWNVIAPTCRINFRLVIGIELTHESYS